MKYSLFIAIVFSPVSTADPTIEEAEKLFRAGKWDESRQSYEKLLPRLKKNAKADALYRIGYCWYRKHQNEKAVEYYRHITTMSDISDQNRANAWLRLGSSLRLLTKQREGIEAFQRISQLKDVAPNTRAEAFLNIAWANLKLENTDKAVQAYRQVIALEKSHANYAASAWLGIGRIHQEKQQYQDAIAAYQAIRKLSPVAATNRARARVYRLECEALLAGDNPFHIKPYLTKVTSNTGRLYWVSQQVSTPIDPSHKVNATVTLSHGKEAQTFKVNSEILSDTVCQLHHADLTGLSPGTLYQYVVEMNGKKASGKFRTSPSPDSAFSFSLIGDTQSYHRGLQPLLDRMAKEKSDFILHVGDITDRGNLWGEWKASFFDPGHEYLKKNVLWPVYGNHDGGPYFPALFGLRGKYYYSFDWGDAHFIVLDSYGAGSGGKGRRDQLAWLEQDLKSNKKRWRFAALHVPMVATRKGISRFGEKDFLPLLEKHGVDIVFSGHHPHYRRYRPLGQFGKQAILHITSGGGGGPVGGYMPSPILSKGIDVNHYCVIDIKGDQLTLTAKAINGAVIDRFTLVKKSKLEHPKTLGKPVVSDFARRIVSLYQELVTDRTYDLILQVAGSPMPNQKAQLILDLRALSRGPLDTTNVPEGTKLIIQSSSDSAWKITSQMYDLKKESKLVIDALAPDKVKLNNNRVLPEANVILQLKSNNQLFEPFKAKARLYRKP